MTRQTRMPSRNPDATRPAWSRRDLKVWLSACLLLLAAGFGLYVAVHAISGVTGTDGQKFPAESPQARLDRQIAQYRETLTRSTTSAPARDNDSTAAGTTESAAAGGGSAPTASDPDSEPREAPGFHLSIAGKPVALETGPAPPKAGLLFNLDTGEVLWHHNPTRKLPIASLTKMMTALLVARDHSLRERVVITRESKAVPGSAMGNIRRGQAVPLDGLLNGLVVVSGNDTAVALAQHDSGTVPRFVRRMNVRARAMGLACTRYVSPHGYERRNRSCAADLAALARADLDEPKIAAIARRKLSRPKFPVKTGRLWLWNTNPIVRMSYRGATGLKTGWHSAAGPCLVATAKRRGVHLGVVLLNSPSTYNQAKQLLDDGFRHYKRQRRNDRAEGNGGKATDVRT